MKNYLKFIPTIFILFGCSSESGVASLKKHNSIQIFPAHPSEQNYDYLVAMQNARTADLDLEQAESSYKEVIDRLLSNGEVQILIVAKQRLATIKENQGNLEQANKLREEAEYINKGLSTEIQPLACPDSYCNRWEYCRNKPYSCERISVSEYCKPCGG